jgi:hypothetical protein
MERTLSSGDSFFGSSKCHVIVSHKASYRATLSVVVILRTNAGEETIWVSGKIRLEWWTPDMAGLENPKGIVDAVSRVKNLL